MKPLLTLVFCAALALPAGAAPAEPSGAPYDWQKTRAPERPWLLPYHQTVVTKLFLAAKHGGGGKAREVDGAIVHLTFAEALEVIRTLDTITLGIPKVVYLVGWQHDGHDSKYPDWSVVNPRLKRPADATALESLRWLIREARKHHTTVSLHVNMFDAYEDSPLFQSYVEKDVIAKDKDGSLIRGEVAGREPKPDTQIYYVSYAREWELGLAQQRIDGLLEMIPELRDGKTIHVDAFHCYRPAGPEPRKVISPLLGYTTEQEAAAMRKIFRTWRDRGLDVTCEGSNFLRPEAFVGLQPMAWWDEPSNLPAAIYCGSPLHAEEEVKADPVNLPGLLDQFCLLALPWHYRNNDTATKGTQVMLDPDVGPKRQPRGRLFEQAMADYGDHVFMPALWREKTIVAYSRTGYERRTWQLPPGWEGVARVRLERITLDGLEDAGEVPVTDGTVTLGVGPREAFAVTPAAR